MKHHVMSISKPRSASIFGDGSQLDPILSLSFVISLLQALNELMGRKNPTTT